MFAEQPLIDLPNLDLLDESEVMELVASSIEMLEGRIADAEQYRNQLVSKPTVKKYCALYYPRDLTSVSFRL